MVMPPATVAPPLLQPQLDIDIIKQHTGLVQVQRAVIVNVPGKHFPQLQPAEQTAAAAAPANEE